jgi:hypothetical protein
MKNKIFLTIALIGGLSSIHMPVRCMSEYVAGALNGLFGALPGAGAGCYLTVLAHKKGEPIDAYNYIFPMAGGLIGGLSTCNDPLDPSLKESVGGGAVGLGIGVVGALVVRSILNSKK